MSAEMDERITVGPARIRTEAIDIDIHGLVLTILTIEGRDLLAQGEGGTGWWVEYDEGEPTEIDNVDEMNFTLHMPDMPDDNWAHLTSTLQRWVENKVPLRLVGLTHEPRVMLVWDGKTMLPLPRS